MANTRAIALMIAAMASFSVGDACLKLVSRTLDVGQIVLITSLGSMLFFLAVLLRQKTPIISHHLRNPIVQLRTWSEVLGGVGSVVALALMPLATVAAIKQSQPLAMTLGAALVLGERVGWRRWAAVLCGVLGVLIILQPGADVFDPNAFWPLIAVLGLTVRDLTTRALPPEISSSFVNFWALIAAAAVGLVVMQIEGGWQPVSAINWVWLAAISAAVASAFATITMALRIGEVSAIAPFRYSRIVFSLLIAYFVLGENPNFAIWLGTIVITMSGLYAFWREQRVQTARPEPHE